MCLWASVCIAPMTLCYSIYYDDLEESDIRVKYLWVCVCVCVSVCAFVCVCGPVCLCMYSTYNTMLQHTTTTLRSQTSE